MALRTLSTIIFMLVALPTLGAAADPVETGGAGSEEAPVMETRMGGCVATTQPTVVLGFQAETQDSSSDCPFSEVFTVEAPPGSCGPGVEDTCVPLCEEQDGVFQYALTSTGNDCTCVCCPG